MPVGTLRLPVDVQPVALARCALHCRRTCVRDVRRHAASVADPKRKSSFTYDPPAFYPELPPRLDVELATYDAKTMPTVDVAIAGAGPAGLATAARISEQGFTVAIVDPSPLAHWPNNYGVWSDEFEAMNLHDCFEIEWKKANVWLGEGKEKTLSRRYARVDRAKLKRKLVSQCIEHDVKFHYGRVAGCSHENGRSILKCQDGTSITASLLVDATGHARRLVQFDQPFDPGYQAAYGILAVVESHPFDLDTMLFMDWRDSHLNRFPALKQCNSELPTFLYAMPFTENRVFLEETSLVARPAISFDDIKQRMYARLQHLGIKVKYIVEEEYCLIPMGGVLPVHGQRVLGIGGTAGMVHPSTGYMVARTLGAVPQLADRIVDELSKRTDRSSNDGAATALTELEAAKMSKAVWHSIWPGARLRQREFFRMGMDVLLKLNLAETRAFFTAFFSLSDFHWQGFLSSRLTMGQLLVFGLSLFANATNDVRLDLMKKGVPALLTMLYNLTQIRDEKVERDR